MYKDHLISAEQTDTLSGKISLTIAELKQAALENKFIAYLPEFLIDNCQSLETALEKHFEQLHSNKLNIQSLTPDFSSTHNPNYLLLNRLMEKLGSRSSDDLSHSGEIEPNLEAKTVKKRFTDRLSTSFSRLFMQKKNHPMPTINSCSQEDNLSLTIDGNAGVDNLPGHLHAKLSNQSRILTDTPAKPLPIRFSHLYNKRSRFYDPSNEEKAKLKIR
jgi:hypothetical protein